MKQYFIPILLPVFLFACSTNGVPPKPLYNLQYEFSSDKNYQAVYRTILNNTLSCTKYDLLSKSVAEGQIYQELNAADITIFQNAVLGKYPHILVSIETEKDKTRVIVKNDFETWDELARVIQDWVIDGTTSCKQE